MKKYMFLSLLACLLITETRLASAQHGAFIKGQDRRDDGRTQEVPQATLKGQALQSGNCTI